MPRPNILVLMVDQLNGTLFPDGPADWLHAPALKRLAARSVRFRNAYTASPLCAPGRASFMSGQLPSRTGVYDNAAEFASDIPTFAHHLRRAGYQTCLSGKMHFVGPDQLHGFESRLTTDIYPADFGWTPDYRKPGERIDWWYHNMGSVTGAGVAEITNQMEYDDEVAFNAVQKLYDLSRGADDRTWCLTVSFTHPHDPYVARKRFWDLYEDCAHLSPQVPAMPYEAHDPHSKRIFDANDWRSYDLTEENIRRSRRAYFANISYLDDKIAQILETLETTRQQAIVVFVSDHGDMLGERGLWYKMNFFEGSARVPLMIAAPGLAPQRIDAAVSTLDVTPTLCDLAGVGMEEVMPWTDGAKASCRSPGAPNAPRRWRWNTPPKPRRHHSCRCATGAGNTIAARSIPTSFSTSRPTRTSLSTSPPTPPMPARSRRSRRSPRRVGTLRVLTPRCARARRGAGWSMRRSGTAAISPGISSPLRDASERYMRNHMDLNVLETSKRFPRGE